MLEKKHENEMQEMRKQAKVEKEQIQKNLDMAKMAGIKKQSQIQRQLDEAARRERDAEWALVDIRRELRKEKQNARAQNRAFDEKKLFFEQELRNAHAQFRDRFDDFAAKERQTRNDVILNYKRQHEKDKSEIMIMRNEMQSLESQLAEANKPGILKSIWKFFW